MTVQLISRTPPALALVAFVTSIASLTALTALTALASVAGAQAAVSAALPGAAAGERVAEHIAAGERETRARRTAAALAHYEAAIAIDPRHPGALWRAAREAVDLGEFETDVSRRNTLYISAVDWARRAVAADERDPEGHFQLSRALGRTALAAGPRDRVKYALDIRARAIRAMELAPRHAGAAHVLGVWHAEVMRLNGVTRIMARRFLGGAVLSTASWEEATRLLELSVASEPDRLVHLLDLARIYRDTKRVADARRTYQAALRAPLFDANDDRYRRTAEIELRALR